MSSEAATADQTQNNSSPVEHKKPKKLGQSSQTAVAKQPPPQTGGYDSMTDDDAFGSVPEPIVMPQRRGGRRMVPVHQSRIADRPPKVGEKDSSLKIKIELDLEVEVEIYARVKGDVMIGLM